MFKGRTLAIATMHGKESVIAPILEKFLGVKIIVPKNFNTDVFGTFAGEIERSSDPFNTAVLKCKAACKLANTTLAVASEGSFGQHPTLFFMPADEEIMVFVDLQNDITIKAKIISTNTNFNGDNFTDWKFAKDFAEKIGFPAHGLIIRKHENDHQEVVKGISNWDELKDQFENYFSKYGAVFLETDMRAMYNPTRMKVIEEATNKLIDVISNQCPGCKFPGYDICEINSGLPCKLCGMPTRSILSFQYKCNNCSYASLIQFPNGKENEDPQFCDFCNP